MSKIITSTDYFNPNGCEILDEKIYGSDVTGFVDFNRSKYDWAKNIYNLMEANTWFAAEINLSNEKKAFANLDSSEQFIYKMIFAQLSFNDSIQASYLVDFNKQTSNSIIRSTLTRQAWEEVNHQINYSSLLDVVGNSVEVFDLYRTDKALARKNKRISEMFARSINGNSINDMLLNSMVSVNLEGIFFLTGFAYIYVLGDKVPGSRDTIAFIARDEINTHLPLFANIFKTIRRENTIDTKIIDKTYDMIREAVDIELEWGEYLTKNASVLGLGMDILRDTIHNYANNRLKRIGLEPIYEDKPDTYLQKLVTKHLNINDVKSNFFEGNVKAYSKGSLDMDF